MMIELVVRSATEADIPAITEIHNQGIADRIATLDLNPHTLDEKRQWFVSHGPREPILVASCGDTVVGFAALSLFSPRQCYTHLASLSLYVARESRGQGLGGVLLDAIITKGKDLRYRKIILNAFAFNTAAMALYRKHGFRHVGTYQKQGLLDGVWVDTVIMEKHLVDD